MHALTAFIQGMVDARGWKQADLVRASGLSAQVVSNLLKDRREALVQRPDQATVDGLARAFGVDADLVLAKVGEAMGIPVEVVREYRADRLTNEQLLAELARRLDAGEGSVRKLRPRSSDAPARKVAQYGERKAASKREKEPGEFERHE